MTVTLDALRGYFPSGGFGRRVQPLPEYGCVYVKNAKAASSTIMLWLHRVHTADSAFVPERNIHAEHTLPSVKDVGRDTVVRMLAGEAFRFSFVRDPLARVESAYRDKVAKLERRDRWRVLVQQALGEPVDPDRVPTFDEFVAALELQEPIQMDSHWRPQHLNLMHGLVEYDLVGRLETFDADLARVGAAIGVRGVPLEVRNVRPPTNSLFDGRHDLRRKVRDIYAMDFELYGY